MADPGRLEPRRWPRLPPWSSIALGTTIIAIFASALLLGRYSYRAAQGLASQVEASIVAANRDVTDQVIRAVEKDILVSDHTLFELVDFENLRDFEKRWDENIRSSQVVEAVAVLDTPTSILKFSSRARTQRERDAFRRQLESKLLPELQLDKMSVNQHMHWHQRLDGESVLLSYTQRVSASGYTFYVVLKISVDYILEHVLPSEFRELGRSHRYAVVNNQGHIVFGDRYLAAAARGYLYERHFPTTLWQWRVQMAPRDVEGLLERARVRRVLDVTVVSASLVVMTAGILVLLLAVRKERRANALKSDFIANVSHELKTPLSLIRMFGELLAMGKVKSAETTVEYAEIITRESDRLARLIDNVLDFARIERGKAAYEFGTGDLADVIERGLDLYRYRLDREKVTLHAQIAHGLPRVRMDENALTLALLNLLENAVKYGGGAEITVRVTAHKHHVDLSVSDLGPGIPYDEQSRIWERFYRGKAERTRPVRGSGIGLSLVKHIAIAHGGDASVTSAPGRGATFVIRLPIEKEDGSVEHYPAEEAAPHRG
jgi:two-component system phosphate regulon sensor histidine kinase PhoR